MKKASIIITVIIVIAIIAGTLVILSIVSSEIFGGISAIWLSQKSCASLNALTEKMDIACEYGYDMVAEINIPEQIENFKIIRLPRDQNEVEKDLIEEHGDSIRDAENARDVGKYTYGYDIGSGGTFTDLTQALADAELTGYHPDINADYIECRGGLCICMVRVGTRIAPRTQNCDYCYPVARQAEPPSFCCDYGICRFENIGNIPDVNYKFVSTSTGEEERETKIFQGLTFMLENKTDNLSWVRRYCNDTIYDVDNQDGVFVVDSYGYGGQKSGISLCGNGIINVEAGEECEESTDCDTSATPAEICNNCRCTTCGNGEFNPVAGEECDFDTAFGDYLGCVDPEICNNCRCTTCGNGEFNPATEQCETTADCPIGQFCDNCECVTSIFSGCCFRQDRLVGPCVKQQMSAQDNKDALLDFVSFSEGSWPLKGRVAVEIHANILGGLTLRLGEYRFWWQLG